MPLTQQDAFFIQYHPQSRHTDTQLFCRDFKLQWTIVHRTKLELYPGGYILNRAPNSTLQNSSNVKLPSLSRSTEATNNDISLSSTPNVLNIKRSSWQSKLPLWSKSILLNKRRATARIGSELFFLFSVCNSLATMFLNFAWKNCAESCGFQDNI